MTNDPDQIRADIERTRSELSNDVNALVDEANPKNMARRQVGRAKDKAYSLRDRIMGSVDDAAHAVGDRASAVTHAVGDRASSVGDSVSSVGSTITDTPDRMRERAEGNPLGAGLVAFGIGLVLSSLFPPSNKERELATSAVEAAEPLKQAAVGAAKDMAEEMREPVREAAESVRETATQAADNVKEAGTSAAGDVQQQASESKDRVRESGS